MHADIRTIGCYPKNKRVRLKPDDLHLPVFALKAFGKFQHFNFENSFLSAWRLKDVADVTYICIFIYLYVTLKRC